MCLRSYALKLVIDYTTLGGQEFDAVDINFYG